MPIINKLSFLLTTEVAMEASEDLQFSDKEATTEVAMYKPEMAIVSAPTILLTLEAGVGNKTLPMLLLHLGFQSNVNDWSTKTVVFRAHFHHFTSVAFLSM